MPAQKRLLVLVPELIAYYRGIVSGVARYCRTHGHTATYRKDATKLTPRDIPDVHGIIAAPITTTLLNATRRLAKPTINVSSRLRDTPFPSVTVDHHAAGNMAAEHFLARGFRHFCYLTVSGPWYAQARGEHFRDALRRAGYDCPVLDLGPDTRPERAIRTCQKRLPAFVRNAGGPVALLACTDFWGWQAIDAARRAAIPVPGQVAVLGIDNDEMLCEMADPSLSSIDVSAGAIGHTAAELLVGMLEGQPPPAAPVAIAPSQLVIRASTDTLPAADADVAAALALIRAHLHTPLHVGDLVASLAVSRRTLERRFEQVLGRSPAQEIRRARMERACQLLAETAHPLAWVARAVGFEHLSHFSMAFKAQVGASPTTYRRRAQFR